MAAEAFVPVADVELPPAREHEELLARIHLSAGRTETKSVDMLAALETRLTDRHGYSTWDLPAARLHTLCEAPDGWGAHAVPLTDPPGRGTALRSWSPGATNAEDGPPGHR